MPWGAFHVGPSIRQATGACRALSSGRNEEGIVERRQHCQLPLHGAQDEGGYVGAPHARGGVDGDDVVVHAGPEVGDAGVGHRHLRRVGKLQQLRHVELRGRQRRPVAGVAAEVEGGLGSLFILPPVLCPSSPQPLPPLACLPPRSPWRPPPGLTPTTTRPSPRPRTGARPPAAESRGRSCAGASQRCRAPTRRARRRQRGWRRRPLRWRSASQWSSGAKDACDTLASTRPVSRSTYA